MLTQGCEIVPMSLRNTVWCANRNYIRSAIEFCTREVWPAKTSSESVSSFSSSASGMPAPRPKDIDINAIVESKGVEMRDRPLYMDLQATTPLDPRVLDAMLPFFVEQFGNPHSRTHVYGWETEEAVERARAQVANLVRADPKEIIFTSGATESNNMAIKGVAHFYKEKKNHIITTQIEHKCVLDSCRILEMEGFKVTYLP